MKEGISWASAEILRYQLRLTFRTYMISFLSNRFPYSVSVRNRQRPKQMDAEMEQSSSTMVIHCRQRYLETYAYPWKKHGAEGDFHGVGGRQDLVGDTERNT